MIYSEVVKSGWILPKKTKYTKHDVTNILTDSLFGKYRANSTLTEKEAKFICKCSAAYHDTDYSVYVKNIRRKEKMEYIGVSNGKEYEILEIDPDAPTCGLVKLDCHRSPAWCTFEIIKGKKEAIKK